jgi:AraC-like DNA-binding protein
MGKTFTNYLNYIRITEAEKLLLTTEMTMTEIAQETGFSSSSYFIQQFKQYKNISPSQFRKKVSSENVEIQNSLIRKDMI